MTAYFPPFVIGDQTYAFDHLEPFGFSFFSNMAKRDLRVHFTFSNHCFTTGWDAALHPEGQAVLKDSGGRPRSFCETRYRLSLDLKGIVGSLNDAQCKVWETASRRNWAYTIRIENPAGPYHLFLSVKRSGREKPQEIDVMIESAYHEEEGAPALLGRMGFWMLCSKVYLRQPTSTKR